MLVVDPAVDAGFYWLAGEADETEENAICSALGQVCGDFSMIVQEFHQSVRNMH